MKNRYLVITLLAGIFLVGCHKDDQLNKEPKIMEGTVDVLATQDALQATFKWTVDWSGKFSSVVEVSENANMSVSRYYGSDAETENRDFTATVPELNEWTTYYYRYVVWNPNYVDNKFLTEVKSFSISARPIVTTAEITGITWRYAFGGGDVNNDGGSAVTERGVCWSTDHNPTVSGSHASSGTGTGSFSVTMTGLEPSTTYYVRAYAMNDLGTGYGNEVSITTTDSPVYPGVAGDGRFSVATGKQVYFSQGNLQYIGSASTPYWKFAYYQWDVLGNGSQASAASNVDRDLFGWGTSGYNGKHPYMTSRYNTDYGSGNTDIAGTNYDWGVYNRISNGGNQVGQWRTLTKDEWVYVFDIRNTSSGIRYAKACVNNMNGVILLPDDWNTSYFSLSSTNSTDASFSSNTISASQWSALEQHGAVFLPVAGTRDGTEVLDVGFECCYWSVSYRLESYAYNPDCAYSVWFTDWNLGSQESSSRSFGLSVRLVRDVQ